MRERLQKLLAAAGVASRRHAEAWIRAGRVSVNGRVASLGDAADPEADRVEVDGRPLRRETHVYWMLHKPRGVLTTVRDPEGRPTVVGLVPEARERVYPVGRLDADTEGLVLLTNDGETAQALLHPSLGSEREYRVWARGRMTKETLDQLARGVELEDGRTAPAGVSGERWDRHANVTELQLVLREGRKRQIRRALKVLGHPVVRLLRVRMGPLRLGDLALGRARKLTERERAVLARHVAHVLTRAQPARKGGTKPPAAAAKGAPRRTARRRGIEAERGSSD